MVSWSNRVYILDGVVPSEDPRLSDIYDNHRSNILNSHIHRLNEALPLTLFQHAFKATQQTIRQFKLVQRQRTLNLRRWRHEQVQQSQHTLLQCIYYITVELGDTVMASRAYRKCLAPAERINLIGTYSERIMFTAQALSKHFVVRGIPHPTIELIDAAVVLKATYHAVISALCRRANVCVLPPYDDLQGVMRQFDQAWVIFEELACRAYFEDQFNAPPSLFDDTDMFQVLMMQTAERAISKGLMTLVQVQESDPEVMVGLPRLTLICGLLHMPDCVSLVHPTEAFRLFKREVRTMASIQESLQVLTEEEVDELEKWCAGIQSYENRSSLSGFTMLKSFPSTPPGSNLSAIFRVICRVADELQSGNRAKEFSQLMGNVIRTFE
ncbi:hypothetical protein BDV3_004338 [Batrachochytrium dendrobatidis]|uniref:Uncharacterized protein n=1 Tax=Batrachochytrium dendrobatidis (strain JEL423) TaxID=403673 RepID=A0A177WHC4_BATDL|nr:hypothetical protein BDEG_22794 [Batrachochytrium dendrobatidis JEL423]